MKNFTWFFLVAIIGISAGCSSKPDCTNLLTMIESNSEAGNFTKAGFLADSLRKCCPDASDLILKADSITDINERLGLDFSVNETDFRARIENYFGQATDSMIAAWERRKWIEWKMIDGRKMYFDRAASNLRLLRRFYEEPEKESIETAADPEMTARLKHTGEIISRTGAQPEPVMPVRMKIAYTIKVEPDVVPEGKTIRCWLPLPQVNIPRQGDFKLLSASEERFTIAPDTAVHRTIYMEKRAVSGTPSVFSVSYTFTSSGIWFDPDKLEIKPYDKTGSIYKKYTAEQLPDICFTDNIRHLADEITSPGDPPDVIVRKIYMWFKKNIPWTGALEYSVIPNIPEYVFENRRGDCGMQTFLFMSMLRYKGIPVRWQSGWKVPPGFKNLHDWCEVYFEGPGWVPADVSYDLQASDTRKLREFYLTGIDSYRLIINNGVSGTLFPRKRFLRSEPYDFQRGEVEWEGGNLYFDKWNYSMQIEYL